VRALVANKQQKARAAGGGAAAGGESRGMNRSSTAIVGLGPGAGAGAGAGAAEQPRLQHSSSTDAIPIQQQQVIGWSDELADEVVAMRDYLSALIPRTRQSRLAASRQKVAAKGNKKLFER